MSEPLRRKSAPIAARQHGVVSRRQLKKEDLTAGQIGQATRSGDLFRQRYAVYTASGTPLSWRRKAMEACLAADGVAFRRTAARLYELDSCRDQRLEVLVSHSRRVRQAGLTVCRTRCLPDADLVVVEGIPATSVARTLADLGSRLTPYQVEHALEDALRRRLVCLQEVNERTAALRVRGRSGPNVLWRILVRRGLLVPTGSGPELDLGRILDHQSLPPHARQHPVRTRVKTYKIDFAYPSARLGVEYDGGHHLTPLQALADRKRERHLATAGWLLVRYSSQDLRKPASVRKEVRETIAARNPLVLGSIERICEANRPQKGI